MDAAYNQHSPHERRKSRSSTNLNHLSLAPLTTRLPLTDPENLPDPLAAPPKRATSYLQGRSAPTTPRLLSSPVRSRSRERKTPATPGLPTTKLPKSRSTTHLHGAPPHARRAKSGSTTPNHHHKKSRDEHDGRERSDSDWLLRVGTLISTEMRESKGQTWLATRQSSTSLVGMADTDDEEEDALEREMEREREFVSRTTSRRGSVAFIEDGHIHTPGSHLGSRSQSRTENRSQLQTPHDRPLAGEGYFEEVYEEDAYAVGPMFVNLDEKLEAIEQDTSAEDEDHVRRLVRRERTGVVGSWFGSVLGWPLSSVQENDEETSDEAEGEATDDETERERHRRSLPGSGGRRFDGAVHFAEEPMPPPNAVEGGWQDAAWLLTVASKVIL